MDLILSESNFRSSRSLHATCDLFQSDVATIDGVGLFIGFQNLRRHIPETAQYVFDRMLSDPINGA